MDINTLRERIKGKVFRSTDGTMYQFVGDNTLRVNNDPRTIAHYSIEEVGGAYLLQHNSLLGTEPFLLEVIEVESPIRIAVSKNISNEIVGTWTEITHY